MTYDFQIFGQRFKKTTVIGDSAFGDSAISFSWAPGERRVRRLVSGCLIDGSSCLFGLKLSFVHEMDFVDCCILGGSKGCVDMIRGGDVSFSRCKFVSRNSDCHASIRGGAKNVSFKNCVFVNNYRSRLSGSCIDLGRWTHYDVVPRPPVRNVSIENCKMKDINYPALTRRFFSMDPDVKNSTGKNLKVPVLFVRLFWLLKRKGFFGGGSVTPPEELKVYQFES
ncbi:MAG: hypothetical protein CL885_04795 [Dehalococcoidia bacterium]|nr:hypothetical protein [Dehalococcoidia bacterium]